MSDQFKTYEYLQTVDPAQIRREKERARVLRKSLWWRQQVGRGTCYHCSKKFLPADLTMDHLIPISRGGVSNKKNIVVSCKQCNSLKKNLTVAELRLRELNSI